MAALGIIRLYRQLKDVDWPTFDDQDVPQWNTGVSKFQGVTMGGGGPGGGSFSMGVSNLGNTLGLTGVTGSRVVLAGGDGITLSQSRDAAGATITVSAATQTVAPQTVQTQHVHDLTLAGNTAGALALVSSGTLTLAGGNSITLSQNGNAVTIAGASTSQSLQTQPIQTGISSIAASDATFTSGQVQFTGSGIVTIRSSAGQRVVVDATVPAQTVQTQNVHNVTLSGNTAGAMAQISSGTWTLAGGSNITVSQNGNAVSIIGNAAGTETQIAISGIAASNTTYTSGTVNIVGSGNVQVQSGTGQRVIISGSQSVQAETQTFVGGVVGSNTTYTSGTVNIVGSGIVTVQSGTGQRVIVNASQSVQPETVTFLGGLAGSNTTYTSGTVTLTGVGGGVTVSSNTGQRIDISVAAPVAQTVQTQNAVDVTISGNTAGAGALVSSGTLTLAGGNNITVSQAGNAITISGANIGGAQTGISGIANSQTTYTSGTVSLSELGAITIRSTTGNQFQLSVAAQTAESQSFGMSNIGNTSGTTGIASGAQVRFLLAGGNNVTLSQSLNGASGTVTISAASQSAESQSIGMSNIGNTSGTTGIASGAQVRMLFAGGNNVTLSQSLNGASGTLTISAASQTVQTQNLHNVTISGNTSGALAAISSGTLTLAGGNNVTLSQAGNAVTISAASQTVQTQNLVDVTISGNTSGAGALISSGTLTLAGGNNITVSQAGNAITISGANVGGAQTGISGLANSQTTFTSGTVSMSELGAITIRSTTGNQFQFSVNAQSVQPETQTFLGGVIASDTTYTSGSVRFTGVGGGVTVSSNTGQRVDISVAAPVAQTGTQFSAGVSNLGNTAGDTGTVAGRLVLVGSNNITLSGSTNGVSQTISLLGAAAGAETQTGISGIANSQTTFTSGTLSLSELGAITIRSTTGNQFQLSVNAQSVQPETQTFVGGIKNSNTTYTSGTVGLSELGAITIRSTTGNQFQFSVAAQSVQAETQTFVGGIIASDTTYTSGSIRFTGVGGGVTVSSNTGQRVDISVAAPVAQTAQTGISGLANSQTTYTSGTVSLSDLANITIRSTTGNQFQFSVAAQTAESQSIGISNLGNTSGTTGIASGAQVRMLFAGGNNVTLSQSLNGASGTITISAAAQSAQTAISGLANSQTTYTSGTVSLSELGAVTIRSTTGNQFQISVNSQTVQTQNMVAVTLSGNTAGALAGISSGTLTLAGGNNITLSQAGNAVTISGGAGGGFSAGISGGNTSGQTGATGTRLVLAGGNNVTLSGATDANGGTVTVSAFTQSVESQSIGMSNLGNTLGTTGIASGGQVRFLFAGTNNITLSQSINGASGTISISGAPSFSGGVSNLGNTGGATGVSGTRLVLVGSNNVTLSQTTDASGATVSLFGQAPAGGAFSGGVSTGGNTAGATGISGTQMVLVGSGVMSLSQTTGANGNTVSILAPASSVLSAVSPLSTSTNGSTISVLGPATSSLSGVSGITISTTGSTISIGYKQNVADWENMPRAAASLITHVSAFSKTPIYWNDHIDCDLTAKSFAFGISMVTASQPLSLSAHLGVYSIVNSTSASLMGSVSEAYVVSSASSVSLSGVRNLVMTGIGTHTALSVITGGEYLVGMMFSATATNAMNLSLLGASGGAGALGGIYPGTNQLSTGTGQGIQVLAGRGSTTVNAMPANVSSADLINQGTAGSMPLHPWIYIRS